MAKSDKEQVGREERRLDNWTADAIVNLFGDEESGDHDDPHDFCDAVKQKGATVSLTLPEGGGCDVRGKDFVDWVWELLANA